MPARSLAVTLAAVGSVLALGGSTPAVAGCGGSVHQEDTDVAWLAGTDDIVFERHPQATCGYPSSRYRLPATGGPVRARDGFLAPDGTRVAYTDGGIRVARLDGSGDLRLTSGPRSGFDSEPAWSPDGTSIAFTRGSLGESDLYVVPVEGSPPRRLTTTAGATETAPRFSPDGAWIAFVDARRSSLGLIRPDGTGRRLVVAGAVVGWAWAPDSTRLAVLTGPRARAEAAYLVGLDGSATRLAVSPASVNGARFSPDGSLALIATGTPPTISTFDAAGHALARMPLAGIPLDLAWSPDGRRLAWASEGGLAVAAADGSDLRTLPDLAAQTVAWSPDGTQLAVAATEPPCETRSGVFVVDAATLAARKLTNDCRIAGTPGDDVIAGTDDDDVIDGLGGDDRISAGSLEDAVSGGGGNDVIAGGAWPDRLDGGPGDDAVEGGGGPDSLAGGPGRDRISGGPGRDLIQARDGEADTISCGAEYDVATVDRADSVARDCEGVLRTARDRYVDAAGGRVAGGPGDDVVLGGRVIHGGAGRDQLFGGPRDSRLFGGPGADRLFGGPGRDLLYGGPGDDVLHARDRARDVLDCGPGRDVAVADPGDVVRPSCERVRRR